MTQNPSSCGPCPDSYFALFGDEANCEFEGVNCNLLKVDGEIKWVGFFAIGITQYRLSLEEDGSNWKMELYRGQRQWILTCSCTKPIVKGCYPLDDYEVWDLSCNVGNCTEINVYLS